MADKETPELPPEQLPTATEGGPGDPNNYENFVGPHTPEQVEALRRVLESAQQMAVAGDVAKPEVVVDDEFRMLAQAETPDSAKRLGQKMETGGGVEETPEEKKARAAAEKVARKAAKKVARAAEVAEKDRLSNETAVAAALRKGGVNPDEMAGRVEKESKPENTQTPAEVPAVTSKETPPPASEVDREKLQEEERVLIKVGKGKRTDEQNTRMKELGRQLRPPKREAPTAEKVVSKKNIADRGTPKKSNDKSGWSEKDKALDAARRNWSNESDPVKKEVAKLAFDNLKYDGNPPAPQKRQEGNSKKKTENARTVAESGEKIAKKKLVMRGGKIVDSSTGEAIVVDKQTEGQKSPDDKNARIIEIENILNNPETYREKDRRPLVAERGRLLKGLRNAEKERGDTPAAPSIVTSDEKTKGGRKDWTKVDFDLEKNANLLKAAIKNKDGPAERFYKHELSVLKREKFGLDSAYLKDEILGDTVAFHEKRVAALELRGAEGKLFPGEKAHLENMKKNLAGFKSVQEKRAKKRREQKGGAPVDTPLVINDNNKNMSLEGTPQPPPAPETQSPKSPSSPTPIDVSKETPPSAERKPAPDSILNPENKSIFEKLSGGARGFVNRTYEGSKMATVDRLKVWATDKFLNWHDNKSAKIGEELAENTDELKAATEGLAEVERELSATQTEFGPMSASVRTSALKQRGALEKTIEKLKTKNEKINSNLEYRNRKKGTYENTRKEIVGDVTGRIETILKPYKEKVEALRWQRDQLDQEILSFREKRVSLEQARDSAKKRMGEVRFDFQKKQIKERLKELDKTIKRSEKLVKSRMKKRVDTEHEFAKVDKKADKWRVKHNDFSRITNRKVDYQEAEELRRETPNLGRKEVMGRESKWGPDARTTNPDENAPDAENESGSETKESAPGDTPKKIEVHERTRSVSLSDYVEKWNKYFGSDLLISKQKFLSMVEERSSGFKEEDKLPLGTFNGILSAYNRSFGKKTFMGPSVFATAERAKQHKILLKNMEILRRYLETDK